MTLKDQLMNDLRDAMRSGDALRRETIRMARAAIQSAEIEERTRLFEQGVSVEEIDARVGLDDTAVQAVLMKAIKQRRESAEEYRRAKRDELADKELAEVAVLEAYLPRQMSDEEIEAEIAPLVAEIGVSGPKDMAKVMPAAMARLKGRADGRAVNRVVARLLSGGGSQG
jgi:uncharacterized protein YqeY